MNVVPSSFQGVVALPHGPTLPVPGFIQGVYIVVAVDMRDWLAAKIAG